MIWLDEHHDHTTRRMGELEPRPHLCSASICWVARERARRTGELTVCSGGMTPLTWGNRVLGSVDPSHGKVQTS